MGAPMNATDPFDGMSIDEVAAMTACIIASLNMSQATEATPESLGIDVSVATEVPRSG